MFTKWLSPHGSHGPLIVLVSLYLIWAKRKDIKTTPAFPGLLPGTILLTSGCFMLFSGKLSSTMLIQQISMIPVLLGTIWLFWGFKHFKLFLLPIGYLVFLMGILETLLRSISIHLQIISAYISFSILNLLGFPVFLSATIIELPHITLEVVQGCSGVNHIFSLLVFSVALADLTQRTPIRKCMLIFMAFLIGIFANGLRIALIGIYTKFNPGSNIHGPYETLYVSFIFFFGLMVVVIVSHLLKKAGSRNGQFVSPVPQKEAWTCSVFNSSIRKFREKNYKCSSSFIPSIIAINIFAITFAMVYFYEPKTVHLKNSLQTFPSFIGGFEGKNLNQIDEMLRPFSADVELMRVYEDNAGNRFEIYIGYFAIQSRDKKIIDYRWAWMHEDVQKVHLGNEPETIRINKTRIPDSENSANIYFWYFMDGRIITDPFAGKFFTFWDALLKRKTNAAVIIVQTKNQENETLIFLKNLAPLIHAHLSAT